jgi:hypothetical protein
VLLPGVALVRAVRPGNAALIEDLGWGIPAGFLVAMAGWAAGAALPWAVPPWLFGPLVTAALFAIPAARPRLLARPAPGWGLRPNLVLCGVLLVVVGWMTVDFLRLNPADPGTAGSIYYPDGPFQLSLVGELRHSLVVTYPMVSGEAYSYHWFGHAVLAHLLNGGVSPFDAVVRLAPATLLPAVVLTAAVVTRGVAGRVSAGPLAAVLLGVLGTTVATRSPDGQSQAVIQTYWWASITTVFGWLASLAVAGCAVAVLRGRGTADVPTRLLVPFLIFCVGAKSSSVPVLLGGAALATVALFVTRQHVRSGLLVVAATAATLAAATLTVYGSGGSGLHIDVFGGLVRNAGRLFPALAVPKPGGLALTLPSVPISAVLVTAVLLYGPLLPRLIGFAFLTGERRDPATWFFAGVVLAGVGATLVFRHPGESEGFFLLSAYPLGLVASAWGLARAADRVRDLPWVKAALVGAGFSTMLAAVIAYAVPVGWASTYRHDLAPLSLLCATLAASFGVVWVRQPSSRRLVTVAIVGAVLGTGVLSTAFYLTASVTTYSQSAVTSPSNLLVTRDDVTAGRWLDEHAGPHDILATNRVCTQDQSGIEQPDPCQAKAFTLPALAERTVYVGGWAYASRNLGTAWDAPQHWTDQPFWDPTRLADEQAAFNAPTPELLAHLYAAGVRWLVADSHGTRPDTTSLDELADRRFSLPSITVWQLRPGR